MHWTVSAGFGVVLASAVVGLAQLWLHVFDPETFVKAMITFGVALVLLIAWNFVERERRASARLHDKSRLD
jgi:hypothetical protein